METFTSAGGKGWGCEERNSQFNVVIFEERFELLNYKRIYAKDKKYIFLNPPMDLWAGLVATKAFFQRIYV